MKPWIGIPSREWVSEKGVRWYDHQGALSATVDAILRAGGIPLTFPITDDLDVIRSLYEQTDGILVAGGGDVYPEFYGEQPLPKLDRVDLRLDKIELPVISWTVLDRKPLFGICRGMQVMNVAFGGTLHQDLPKEPIFHDISFQAKKPGMLAHPVRVSPGSRLRRALGVNEVMVNTMHHQALDKVAADLKVVGRSPDGVIEAVEGRHGHHVVGVQWHPEALLEQDPVWQELFNHFVLATSEFAREKALAV